MAPKLVVFLLVVLISVVALAARDIYFAENAVRFHANVVSSASLALTVTDVGPGAWRCDVIASSTGTADAKQVERAYLLLDDGPAPLLSVKFEDNELEIEKVQDAVVHLWRSKPLEKHLIAMHQRRKPWHR